MASPEHIFRHPEFSAPDIGAGSGFSGASEPVSPPRDKDALVARIKDIPRHGSPFESFNRIMLEGTGMLTIFEQAGIVPPPPEDPCPFDKYLQVDEGLKWVQEHPEAFKAYREAVDARNAILDGIYLGERIYRIMGGKWFFPNMEERYPYELTSKALVRFWREEYEARTSVEIEEKMRSNYENLLPALEEAGIIPRVEQPPAEWSRWNQSQHEQWMATHSDYTKRSRMLQHLHIGLVLNPILHEVAFRAGSWLDRPFHDGFP